ncbi:hypothetical protein SAMD00023353_5400380 [Rosellinia necatrix]|uniref:Uncharacterized protein n=1 Tax=Rosellinia necatrix TaxID=77044 RepID=A0A1W2TR99_ROSNE|nr:hypothetical protein SAMD00023353_5400380 [Rosellinia necatrix]
MALNTQPDQHLDQPPSYEEAMGLTTGATNNAAQTNARRLTTTNRVNGNNTRPFPVDFNMQQQSANRHIIFAEDTPLYLVTTQSSASRQPNTGPKLARIQHEPRKHTPELNMYSRPGALLLSAVESLRIKTPFTRATGFSVNVPLPPTAMGGPRETRREHFEWRHSGGVEVESLDGRHSGWKLVRLSSAPTTGTPPPPYQLQQESQQYHPLSKHSTAGHGTHDHCTHDHCTHGHATYDHGAHDAHNHRNNHHSRNKSNHKRDSIPGQTSDGKEVVAVWATDGPSTNGALHFRFLGSGADGSLGDEWAIMAVASALSSWNQRRSARDRSLFTARF